MIEINTKEFLRIFGIFTGILLVFFLIDFGFIRLAQKNWTVGMSNAVKDILEEKQPGVWNIDRSYKVNSPFSTSAAVFEVQNMENGKRQKAVLVRVTTIFGPYPALFIYDATSGSDFMGFACVHGRVKTLLEENKNTVTLNYWAGKVKDIIDAVPGGQ